MDQDSDEVYFDAVNWADDNLELDYDDPLDQLLFPASDDLPPPSQPPKASVSFFYEGYTAALRNALHADTPVHERVRDTLIYMQEEQGLNLELFLDALFWGDPGCISDRKVRHERTTFVRSPTLISVLNHWWRPSTGEQSGGGERMKDFVLEKAMEVLNAELDGVAQGAYRVPKDQDPLTQEYLTSLNLRNFGNFLQTSGAPRLWLLLQSLASTDRQIQHNTMKNPFHVCLVLCQIVDVLRNAITRSSSLSYLCSPSLGRMTRVSSP